MDSWILKQLRATVQSDLEEFIPKNYFESEIEELKVHESLLGSELLSYEMTWGNLAVKLGGKLHSKSPVTFTARQVSACDLLMNLGLLVGSEAQLNVTEQLSKKALANGGPDYNSGNVVIQLKTEQIPIFRKNVIGALEQYFHHLSYDEIKPYISLLPENKQKEIKSMAQEHSKVTNNTVNIAGSNDGIVQVGEHNENNQPNVKTSALKWFAKNIMTLIFTIIAGVVVFEITIG